MSEVLHLPACLFGSSFRVHDVVEQLELLLQIGRLYVLRICNHRESN